jgi:hypothetical protein
MDFVKTAKEMREAAAKLNAAADALDPPQRRKRAYKRRTTKATVQSSRQGNGAKLPLGTAGHTSHPADPDAAALRDSLVHTEG